MKGFEEILDERKIFKNKTALSPSYIPEKLPFREKELETIMRTVAPALLHERPKNLFIYGKTGTGKTCSTKFVMQKFNETAKKRDANAYMEYINCKMHKTPYRVLQKVAKRFEPKFEKGGFGMPFFYEKLLEILNKNTHIILILDEIDGVSNLDELIYTLTRINDEAKAGSMSIIGISNKFEVKKLLDARSKSSLYENEIIFAPYTAIQIKEILKDRSKVGLAEGTLDESALNLISVITANESGDARFALRLLEKSAEIAEMNKKDKITDLEVEEARKNIEIDIIKSIISKLPENHKLVLLAIALIAQRGSKYARLTTNYEKGVLAYGEVYEGYLSLCGKFKKNPRTSRWVKTYLNELEELGLITSSLSGKGIRGHTTIIRISYDPKDIIRLIKIDDNYE